MKNIYYISKNKRMVGVIKQNSNNTWSMYRGLINSELNYCGDFENAHSAMYKMEKDGWEEIKNNT